MTPAQQSFFDSPPVLPAAALVLRDYQVAAINELDKSFQKNHQFPLLVLPTAAGKTVIAAEYIRREVLAGLTVLFLAPRRELVFQTSEKLTASGVHHGVLLAGADHLRNLDAPVQVASIDTLRSRIKHCPLPDFNLIFMDEAHLSITKRRQELFNHWPQARRIGLTATPTRKDGRALGMLYDDLIEPATTAELTEQGFLAPARYFSVREPDLEKVRVTRGDYDPKELNAAMNRPTLVGDISQTWLERAPERRTVVFCVSIDHSRAVTEAFLRLGVAAEHVDAHTSHQDRQATFKRFSNGRTQVLTNCFLASYGFDLPVLSCVVLARPTKSLMFYLQMIGRGLRIAPGKADCIVLDHSGCVHRFGFATDERHWTLEGRRALVNPPGKNPKENPSETSQIDCPECFAVFSGSRSCPECGFHVARPGRQIETVDGELVEIGVYLEPDERDKLMFLCELKGYADEKEFKPGWIAHTYRDRFGDWPPKNWRSEPATVPTLATRRWIKSRLIRHAKSKERAAMIQANEQGAHPRQLLPKIAQTRC